MQSQKKSEEIKKFIEGKLGPSVAKPEPVQSKATVPKPKSIKKLNPAVELIKMKMHAKVCMILAVFIILLFDRSGDFCREKKVYHESVVYTFGQFFQKKPKWNLKRFSSTKYVQPLPIILFS
jgi:hypothetical protein